MFTIIWKRQILVKRTQNIMEVLCISKTIINCTDKNLIQTKHWKHGVGRESQSEEEKWKWIGSRCIFKMSMATPALSSNPHFLYFCHHHHYHPCLGNLTLCSVSHDQLSKTKIIPLTQPTPELWQRSASGRLARQETGNTSETASQSLHNCLPLLHMACHPTLILKYDVL